MPLNQLTLKTLFLTLAVILSSPAQSNEKSFSGYVQALIGNTQRGVAKGSLAAKWNAQSGHYLVKSTRDKITAFSRDNLSGAYNNTRTVFYPFGGPDAIYPHLFFPHMTNLILVGTEKIGSLPDLTKNPDQYVTLNRIMGTLFDHTFYHTIKMRGDQESSPANASYTKILASLALFSADIKSSELLSWTNNGQLALSSDPASSRILRITYTLPNTSQLRSVYYFQQNLGDSDYNGLPSLKSSSSTHFVNFLKARRGFTSFYKAASFLSHHNYFSEINKTTLSLSNYIVQTDTGVPYNQLKNSDWDIQLFGNYVWPRKPFEGSYRQSDLAHDCNHYAKELPFGYCYNVFAGGSHLIYAVKAEAKKEIPRAIPVE
jgi:hypothetical protein